MKGKEECAEECMGDGAHHRGVVGMVRFPGEPDEPESGLDYIAEAEQR